MTNDINKNIYYLAKGLEIMKEHELYALSDMVENNKDFKKYCAIEDALNDAINKVSDLAQEED